MKKLRVDHKIAKAVIQIVSNEIMGNTQGSKIRAVLMPYFRGESCILIPQENAAVSLYQVTEWLKEQLGFEPNWLDVLSVLVQTGYKVRSQYGVNHLGFVIQIQIVGVKLCNDILPDVDLNFLKGKAQS